MTVDQENSSANIIKTEYDARKRNGNPFDAFLSSFFSAMLALLLAWRIVFFKDKRPPSIEGYSTEESEADESEICWSIDGDQSARTMTDRSVGEAPTIEEAKHSREAPPPQESHETDVHVLEKSKEGVHEAYRGESPESTSSTTTRSLKSVSHLLETDIIPPVPSLNLASTSFSSTESSPQGSRRPKTAPPPPPVRSGSTEPPIPEIDQEEEEQEPQSPIITINTFGVQRDQARASLYQREEAEQFSPEAEIEEEEIYAVPEHGHPWAGQPEYVIYGPSFMSFMAGTSGLEPHGYGGLDSITEEDSDDLRSHSSASSHLTARAPSTDQVKEQVEGRFVQVLLQRQDSTETERSGVEIIELPSSDSERASKKAGEETPSEPRTPTSIERRPFPVDEEEESELVPSAPTPIQEAAKTPDTIIAQEVLSEVEESLSEEPPAVGTPSREAPRPLIAAMTHEQKREKRDTIDSVTMDADRDQHEVVISSEDQFASILAPMEDGRVSSTSISINLDRSRDSLLDQSVCSNPRDETAILAQLQAEQARMNEKRRDESDDALPPFPPPPPPIEESTHPRNESTPMTFESSSISAASTTTTTKSPQEERIEPLHKTDDMPQMEHKAQKPSETFTRAPGGTERISSFVHGYGGRLGFMSTRPEDYEQPKSPLLWSSSRVRDGSATTTTTEASRDEGNKENSESQRDEKRYRSTSYVSSFDRGPTTEAPGNVYSYEQKQSTKRHSTTTERPHDHEVDLERSMKRFARYGQIYADSPLSYIPNVETSEMHLPPTEPPPPPQPTSVRGYGDPSGYHYRHSSRDTSRDDLISEGHRSRSTIREIPIQRSSSSFGPAITAPSSMPYEFHQRAPSAGAVYHRYIDSHGAPAEEYYRREVMTRTLITRSNDALSQISAPPLGRSSPVDVLRHLPLPEPRDDVSVEYTYKYSRNLEEEERRIRENQEKRQREEEDRRRREEENRRLWEQRELELVERLRREREQMENALEAQIRDRERQERDRIEKDRVEREKIEMRRRQEWERLEDERRALEEAELAKRRELERLEKERLEREKLELERRERERLERERRELERQEAERLERERIERERIEIERLEIERIERIKREKAERDRREKEREREEAERRERERLEAERLERERIEMERRERELIEIQRREAEQRERERREDELRERRRQEQERRDREMLEQAEREAVERERQRRIQEKLEQERLENLRREQERLELERLEIERRERERAEAERRERELLEAQQRNKERRELERLEEERRERERQEEERREKERRERERLEALERERQRQIEEQRERERLAALEATAAERRAQRALEDQRERERIELERRAEQIREMERREAEKRERERLEEERRLAELRDLERRNAELRERERREAAEREARRRQEDRRSRDRLDLIAKEREERERWEQERRRLLAEREAQERKRKDLTSKETLERLTRKPYYSRENLSNLEPEVTTKVERQVIERVDRQLWTSEGFVPSTTYHYSSGGALPPPLDSSPTDDFSLNGYSRERMYHPRKPEDDFLRGSSNRTSRYKAKMEKARQEFLRSDQPPSDPLSDRFRKSIEDLGRRPEYRGPLLQKFHSGEFSSRPELDSYGYPRMGPSPYEKEYRRLLEKARRSLSHYIERDRQSRKRHWSTSYLETDLDSGKALPPHPATETNLDDVHRSKSVLDYNNVRHSRRDLAENGDAEQAHSRSKSADYLMDRRTREETAPPENELQKTAEITEKLSEHEMRFRKSVEKLSVPDWYRDYSSKDPRQERPLSRQSYVPPVPTTTTSESRDRYEYRTETSSRYGQPWSYTETAPPPPEMRHRTPSGSPIGGIAFPPGMFDKYKDEIEDMRRSRTSLHQLGMPQEHTKELTVDLNASTDTTTIREEIRETISREEIITSNVGSSNGKHLPGYTVSTIPSDWNLSRNRNSRVIEVADTFVGKPPENVEQFQRYGGRVTLEEVLDSIFQETKPSNVPIDPSLPRSDRHPGENYDGPAIYTTDYMLMDKIIQQPHLAETLLKKESLYVRCGRCNKSRHIQEAKLYYVSCKHCYTYYCSRQCRLYDWEHHRDRCSFARINTLCKEVIMKVRRDPRAQYAMSMVAREGFKNYGRGSVNIRLHSAHAAQQYLEHGWKIFANIDQRSLLFYYPIQTLIDQRKEQSLIMLCQKYNPNEKFILSVSLIADIEQCPETPPPEPYVHSHQRDTYDYRDGIQDPYHQVSASTPEYGALVPTNV